MLGQHLDGDRAVQASVASPINLAHTSSAELGFDLIRTERAAWLQWHGLARRRVAWRTESPPDEQHAEEQHDQLGHTEWVHDHPLPHSTDLRVESVEESACAIGGGVRTREAGSKGYPQRGDSGLKRINVYRGDRGVFREVRDLSTEGGSGHRPPVDPWARRA